MCSYCALQILKEGFTSANLRSYVPIFVHEVEQYIRTNQKFRNSAGICDISTVFDEIALYCAAASLQGREVRSHFDSTFAKLYRHLDDGFAPINFMLPGLPLPINRRRDHAQRTMAKLYMSIINDRRRNGKKKDDADDMLWTLVDAEYKDGSKVTDEETANLMIALLMGGQVSHGAHCFRLTSLSSGQVLSMDELTSHSTILPQQVPGSCWN